MVKVRIHGDDTRKDADGIAHVSWSEAQAMVDAGNAEILQGEDVEEPTPAIETDTGAAEPSDSMTREELDAMARDRGLSPEDYRTKADLAAALRG